MNWPMRRIGDFTSIVTKGTTPTKAQGFSEYGINYIKAEALNGDVSLDLSGGFFKRAAASPAVSARSFLTVCR